MTAYDELLSKVKETTLLGSAAGILNWDMLTYMPPGAMELRGEQLGAITQTIYRIQNGVEYTNLISESHKRIESYDAIKKRNVHLLKQQYDQTVALPEGLLVKLTKQRVNTRNAWNKARSASDWNIFRPELQKMFDICSERAELLMKIKGTETIYDTIVDDFEPKTTTEQISNLFSELRDGLVPLVTKLSKTTQEIDISALNVSLTKESQRKILTDLSGIIGYDISSNAANGRFDESHHPFTVGYFDDVRITVRYSLETPFDSILVFLHEVGHAMYEQSFSQEWKFQPVGSASSMGIHESISRFFENMIGRSEAFWTFYLPKLNKFSKNAYSSISSRNLTHMINRVTPSKIRVTADEVTYSLHVIIRFEIEQELFNGQIRVSELPAIWNEKYKKYLGIDIDSDVDGVLQDSHWADGMFGYFPSYALGNIYGGMWYDKLSKDIPDWIERTREGNLIPVKQWLVENVMQHANMYDPLDLVSRVTGSAPSARPFLNYLENKFSSFL